MSESADHHAVRQYLIATIDRRPGTHLKLMDEQNRQPIGVMEWTPRGRHEMLMSEADFLKHNRALALLPRRLGFAVFVAEIRGAAQHNPSDLIEAFANMHHSTLGRMARERGIDLTGCVTNADRAARINAATVPA